LFLYKAKKTRTSVSSWPACGWDACRAYWVFF